MNEHLHCANSLPLLAAIALVASFSPLTAQPAPARRTARIVWQSADDNVLQLSRISGIAVDASNRAFVSMPTESMVYAFSADGKLIGKFGRKGGGPGEFQRNCCAAFDGKGRLWVQDIGGARYVVFTIASAGATITAKPAFVVPLPHSDVNFGVRLQFDAQDNVFSVGHVAQSGDRAVPSFARFRTASDGKVIAKVVEPTQTENVSQPFVNQVKDGLNTSTYYVWQPFGASVIRADGPGGMFALAGAAAYSVRWYDANGALLRTISSKADGPLLSSVERKEADSTLAADALQQHTTVSALPFKTPARKPPLAAMYFDADGRLWVQRSTAAGAMREADVYSANGTLQFIAAWPANISLASSSFIRGASAWGVLYDADEVPHVVRLEFPDSK